MIGLGFNRITKQRLMQEYPADCKIEFLVDVQDASVGEIGTVLDINDDLGLTVQLGDKKLLTLYEFCDMVQVVK